MTTARVLLDYPEISREEFDRRLALALAELDGPEGQALRDHIRWFRKRYPTALDRLRYARRKYEQWSKTRGIVVDPR